MLHQSGVYAAGMRTESVPKNPGNEEKKGNLQQRSMFVAQGWGRREGRMPRACQPNSLWVSFKASMRPYLKDQAEQLEEC